MSLEIPQPELDTTYSHELAASVIYEEIQHTEGFLSLSPEQKRWFEIYAAPRLVDEALLTGQVITKELADDSETQEERLSREAGIFMQGADEVNRYLGRD